MVVGSAVGVGAAGYGALDRRPVPEGLTVHQLLRENLFPTGIMRESVSVVFDQLAR